MVGLEMYVADSSKAKNIFGGKWKESSFISITKKYVPNPPPNKTWKAEAYGAIFKSTLEETIFDPTITSPIL
jgi:hypothetical protein